MKPFRKNRKTVIYHRHFGFFLKKSWMGIEWSQNHTATWRWRAGTPTANLQHTTPLLNTLFCPIERLASTNCVWLAQVYGGTCTAQATQARKHSLACPKTVLQCTQPLLADLLHATLPWWSLPTRSQPLAAHWWKVDSWDCCSRQRSVYVYRLNAECKSQCVVTEI